MLYQKLLFILIVLFFCQGHAQELLVSMVFKRWRRVFKKALHWYEKASDMGSEKATELLEEYSGNSMLGVLKNDDKVNFYRNRLNKLRTASDDLIK